VIFVILCFRDRGRCILSSSCSYVSLAKSEWRSVRSLFVHGFSLDVFGRGGVMLQQTSVSGGVQQRTQKKRFRRRGFSTLAFVGVAAGLLTSAEDTASCSASIGVNVVCRLALALHMVMLHGGECRKTYALLIRALGFWRQCTDGNFPGRRLTCTFQVSARQAHTFGALINHWAVGFVQIVVPLRRRMAGFDFVFAEWHFSYSDM